MSSQTPSFFFFGTQLHYLSDLPYAIMQRFLVRHIPKNSRVRLVIAAKVAALALVQYSLKFGTTQLPFSWGLGCLQTNVISSFKVWTTGQTMSCSMPLTCTVVMPLLAKGTPEAPSPISQLSALETRTCHIP
jgi:hypothetical protein